MMHEKDTITQAKKWNLVLAITPRRSWTREGAYRCQCLPPTAWTGSDSFCVSRFIETRPQRRYRRQYSRKQQEEPVLLPWTHYKESDEWNRKSVPAVLILDRNYILYRHHSNIETYQKVVVVICNNTLRAGIR
jgi:hypothetical protein